MTTMVEARPQRAPRMGALSDADLVARAQAGDREAFDPLYRRYASQIARFAAGRAVRWGRGPDFAEDVAASTWETALSKIDQYQGLAGRAEPGYEDCSPFRAWLYGVAKHQLFHTAQAAGFEVATAAEDLAWLGERAASVPAEYGEDDQAGRQALRARVYQAVAELCPTQRAVTRLRLDGLDYGEIAERTGLTRRQVGDAWRKGQRHLQRALSAVLADAAAADDAALGALARLRALDEMAAANEVTDPETERARRELRARVDQAVAGLRGRMQREVARLYLAGLGYAEIAERTGWTPMAVNNAWFQAKRNLHTALAATSSADAAPPDALTRLRMLDNLAAAGQATDAQDRERTALRARVDQAVAALPPKQREMAQLRLAGLNASEAAEKAGSTYMAAHASWCDAKRSINRALTDTAPTDATGQHPTPTNGARHHPWSTTTVDAGVASGPDTAASRHCADVPGSDLTSHVPTDPDTAASSCPSVPARARTIAAADDTREAPRGPQPTSEATAVCHADASPVDARRVAVDDSADDAAGASTPDIRPDTWQDSGPDIDAQAAGYRTSRTTDDDTGWRHQRELVGAGVAAGDVRARARVDADDDADGW